MLYMYRVAEFRKFTDPFACCIGLKIGSPTGRQPSSLQRGPARRTKSSRGVSLDFFPYSITNDNRTRSYPQLESGANQHVHDRDS